LRLSPRRAGTTLVIEVTGRVGSAAASELSGALANAITAGDRRIVLDLNGLDYISSAGILAVEGAAARLRSEGGALVLSGVRPPVRLALELAGFPEDVEIVAAGLSRPDGSA
jgi:stage II sporulation protein AA (anti-sigma F factor antagonist)